MMPDLSVALSVDHGLVQSYPGSVNSPIKRTGDWRSPGKTRVRPRSVIGTAVPVPGHATASRRPPVREFTGRAVVPRIVIDRVYTDSVEYSIQCLATACSGRADI